MKKLFTVFMSVFLIVFLTTPPLSGQDDDTKSIKKKLPEMLGANNVGKEFYITIPPCFEDESAGFDNFIKIFVTAATKTLVTVENEGSGYYKAKKTVANDVIEFNITPVQGQPFTKGGRDPNVPERIFRQRAIHIYADQPLVVYCVIRYHWTSDGFLAIPVSSLGKEYIVAGWNVDAMFNAVWRYKLPNMAGIVGAYDDTRVRFTLGGNVMTRTAGGMRPGQSKEFILQKGDVWLVSTDADEADLSGSKIIANKPVALVTGNMCNNIPTGNQWCDYTVEMDLPTFTWGLDYFVPKVPNRKYSSIIRIFAKEPNTNIFKDGRQIGQIKTAGGTEGNAFLTMRMVPFDVESRSVVVSGDKPIGVTLYNTGIQEDGYPRPNSDPFVMVMTPFQQYQKEITFCTPGIMGAQGFPENYLNLVYETDEYGMMPDDYEFAKVQSGVFKWTKLRSKFPGQDELFIKEIAGKKFAAKTITLPGDGVYKIRAKHLFAAYSFGYSDFDSYGFPTSAALADLEKPDTNCPVPTYTMECDGTVKGAIVTDMPDDSKIRSNLAMIFMDDFESYNYTFEYLPFIAGETRTTTWELKVIDPMQDAQATLVFADRRGNDTTIVVKYYAVKLGIIPKKHDFGLLKLNDNKVSYDFEVVNESETAPALVSEIKLQLNTQNYELDLLGETLPKWLGPKATLPFKVWFDPKEMGDFRDSIGVGDTCVFAYKSEVRAKVSEPQIEVSDIDFGVRSTIDPVITKEFTLTNPGKSTLTITRYEGPSLPEYTAVLPAVDGNGDLVEPITLEPGDVKMYEVSFKPTTVNTFNDEIVFFSDADKIDSICLITGRSVEPGLRTRDYDWKKVRIDRPTFPRGPYQPNIPTVWFFNDGTQDVTITDMQVNVISGDGSAFIFHRSDFVNLTISKGDSVVVPVTFQPTAVGEYQIELVFENNAGIEGVKSILKGVGILPRLRTRDYNFGTTIVNDFTNIQTQTIEIENVSYEWQDTVYIQDLVASPNGGIQEDMSGWGSEGFRYDKSALNMPVLLNPGEMLTFDAEFVASKVGLSRASVSTVSEAESEVTSNWTGTGYSQSMELTGGSSYICVGSEEEIVCTVTNSGSGEITVGPLRLSPITSFLNFKQPNPWNQPVTIPAHETRNVVLTFTPNAVVNDRIYLVVPSSIQGNELDSVAIDVRSVHFIATTSSHVLRPDPNRSWPQIGDVVPCNITFRRDNGDIAMAEVDKLDITVRYNGGIFKLQPESVKIGSALNGFEIQNLKINDQMGIFTLEIVSPTQQMINTDGEILTFRFSTFLPTDKDTTDVSPIYQETYASGNACIEIRHEQDTVELQPTCVYDLRWIATSGVQYSLSKITPNPVDGSGTEVEFSVGLEAYTEIGIYNTLGELVAKPVSGIIKPGEYSFTLPVKDLPSGAYHVRMISGPFSKTRELIIRK